MIFFSSLSYLLSTQGSHIVMPYRTQKKNLHEVRHSNGSAALRIYTHLSLPIITIITRLNLRMVFLIKFREHRHPIEYALTCFKSQETWTSNTKLNIYFITGYPFLEEVLVHIDMQIINLN